MIKEGPVVLKGRRRLRKNHSSQKASRAWSEGNARLASRKGKLVHTNLGTSSGAVKGERTFGKKKKENMYPGGEKRTP